MLVRSLISVKVLIIYILGWTPLHEACNHGWYEVAFRLVQSGANVNAKGLDNDTPLHDAAINGHLKLVKLLVERGADIHAKNSKGKTPLDVAPQAVKPYLLNATLPLPGKTHLSMFSSLTLYSVPETILVFMSDVNIRIAEVLGL